MYMTEYIGTYLHLLDVADSVQSQSNIFDLTQVSQVVTNRLDLSRSSTWIFSTKLEKLENVQFSMVPNMEALIKL